MSGIPSISGLDLYEEHIILLPTSFWGSSMTQSLIVKHRSMTATPMRMTMMRVRCAYLRTDSRIGSRMLSMVLDQDHVLLLTL